MVRRIMRSLACAALCPSLFIGNAPAAASEPSQDPSSAAPQKSAVAQCHFDDAVTFYKSGNYDAAKVEFSAAYDLSHLPDLLLNLSMVAKQQGRYHETVTLEERCLTDGRVARLPKRMAGGPQNDREVERNSLGCPDQRNPKWPLCLVGSGCQQRLGGRRWRNCVLHANVTADSTAAAACTAQTAADSTSSAPRPAVPRQRFAAAGSPARPDSAHWQTLQPRRESNPGRTHPSLMPSVRQREAASAARGHRRSMNPT